MNGLGISEARAEAADKAPRSEKVNVLQVIPDLGTGGAERMLADLATRLDPKRFRVKVVTLFERAHSTIERELDARGIELLTCGKHLGFDSRMFARLYSLIRTTQADVVHTHRAALQYCLPAAAALRRVRFVHTVHNVAQLEVPRLSVRAHSLAFRVGVRPVVLGAALGNSFKDVYPGRPYATIPNGIDVPKFRVVRAMRAATRVELGLKESAQVFLCAARHTPQKNIQLLIESFGQASARVPEAVLVLAGDGPLRGELERFAEARGVRSRVLFLGARSDMPRLMWAADVFALTSDWEGCPLSVMEAMAAGLPVIGTSVGGVEELVGPSSGILVPKGARDQLTEAMLRLAVDSSLRKGLGRTGEQIAEQKYDLEIMVGRYAQLYEELLESR